MSEYKTELKDLLLKVDQEHLEQRLTPLLQNISEKELAAFFIDSVYLKTVIQFVIQDHWVVSKDSLSEITFDRFIKKYFKNELQPLLFLHSFFTESDLDGMHIAEKVLTQLESFLVKNVQSRDYAFQKIFLQTCLARMSELYDHEMQMNAQVSKKPETSKMSLYRSFDVLDQIFGLEYILTEASSIDQKERLYEGAGVGVQSSYATTLIAIKYLNLTKGSKFIDLGSGYGRIGLVLGLMRPDISFVGYEFVKERVEIANKACANLSLSSHVQFIAQDLADPQFQIPVADTYYIFDSFSDQTFASVMKQLEDMSLTSKVAVITKGNAKLWMKKQFWSEPQEFNDGNLCLYRAKHRAMSN